MFTLADLYLEPISEKVYKLNKLSQFYHCPPITEQAFFVWDPDIYTWAISLPRSHMNLCSSWAFSQPSAVNAFYQYTVQFLMSVDKFLNQIDFVANWL